MQAVASSRLTPEAMAPLSTATAADGEFQMNQLGVSMIHLLVMSCRYAVERTNSFIKVWFWSRNGGTVPADVSSGSSSVNTANWVRLFFNHSELLPEQSVGDARGVFPGYFLPHIIHVWTS